MADDVTDQNIVSKLLDLTEDISDLGVGKTTADNLNNLLLHAAIRIRVLETEIVLLRWKIEELKNGVE